MRKYFLKIHEEFLDRGHDPIEKKTISINQRWSREVFAFIKTYKFYHIKFHNLGNYHFSLMPLNHILTSTKYSCVL